MPSNIFIQNNTPFNFTDIKVSQTGARLASSRWKQHTNQASCGRRSKILTFNRDKGITNGKNFFFTTRLSIKGSELHLKQQLRGRLINSRMWQSLAGPGFSDPWYRDRVRRSRSWNTGDFVLNVKYNAYFTGSDDDIEYILQYRYPVKRSGRNTINVLAYNIYMRPSGLFINGQSHRTRLLPPEIRGYDVIVFSEAFDNALRRTLLESLRPHYPYATRVVGTDRGIEQDGGVIIVSRWPITHERQQTFGKSACYGSDCMSDKGVLYARIDKQGTPYHIFGTHTQADHSAKDRAARLKQLHIIRRFIDAQQISNREAVIIAGDLNVNQSATVEFGKMLDVLCASCPNRIGLPYSFNPRINDLASGRPEHLDYVLWSKRHLSPKEAYNEVRIPRARSGWKDLATEKERWDLSDHFPVYGRLTF